MKEQQKELQRVKKQVGITSEVESKSTTIQDEDPIPETHTSRTVTDKDTIVSLENAIDSEISHKMHRVMNRTQAKWHVNGLKLVNYHDQRIDQRTNRHIKY